MAREGDNVTHGNFTANRGDIARENSPFGPVRTGLVKPLIEAERTELEEREATQLNRNVLLNSVVELAVPTRAEQPRPETLSAEGSYGVFHIDEEGSWHDF